MNSCRRANVVNIILTSMHSSRMRATHSSSRWGEGGAGQFPLNFPLGCGLGPDPPQLHPWVWAWTRSLSTFPLDVDLDQIPLNFPLGCGPGDHPRTRHTLSPGTRYTPSPRTRHLPGPGSPWDHISPQDQAPPQGHAPLWDQAPPPGPGTPSLPPVDRMTDTCNNITFTNFVCGW